LQASDASASAAAAAAVQPVRALIVRTP
jgi:hypothetical protein